MTNVMHTFLIYLTIYIYLTCFGLSFSPSSETGVQLNMFSWVWCQRPGADTIPRRLEPLSKLNKLKACALRWSLYKVILKCKVLTT
jgi:hypothetical protein